MEQKLTEIEPIDPEQVKKMEVVYNNKKILNMSDIVDKIIEVTKSHYIQPLDCDLCCEPKSNDKLGRACGRTGCERVICNTCGKQWYGENKIGQVINLRHCLCMFCCRAPGPKVIKRWWDNVALALTRNLPPMDQTKYYAWCVRCNLVKSCADRACGAGQAPRFENFECEQCEVDRIEAERILREQGQEKQNQVESPYNQIKNCPNCQVPTIRYAGCNHITCQCGSHWCFECGGEFDSSTIYTHMNRVHGRIYANEQPEFLEYEGYESD